ncbi:berberine bridge enzyme-like 22 [Mangifera indica]|uniref:berberine bridge enzyme-like 22 n=1 Tax=Mangifera indica TaxID=29780 RepID=UPI001CFAA6CD|nr:berberine bridge enzyme-like 22 [Mangifera indica]
MKQIIVLISILIAVSWATSRPIQEEFRQCMSTQFKAYTRSFEIIFPRNSSLYSSLLQSTIQNPRWLNATTFKPLLIVTPFHESEVQAAILCSRKYDLQIRVRSGGHDYEGLSFLCRTPFIIIDLINMRSIEVDIKEETAWIQSGATLGELYYTIAKKSLVHGFPAGLCPTVGIGGHLSGGGFGTLVRKFGVAADNVVDAYLIDVNGRLVDRKAMGEELFWAIRGGGGGNFGVILSWKIKLVRVPKSVTVFTVPRTVEQSASELIHRWQYIAPEMHEDLFIRIVILGVGEKSSKGKRIDNVSFNSLFLGGIDSLIPLMNKNFPELGLKAEDCTEMTWVESTIYFAGFPKGSPLEVLLDKEQLYKSKFKAKSDFVTEPIPKNAIEGIWKMFQEEEEIAIMIMDPFGGKMNEILEFEVPFPHRKGNLYNIQYMVKWDEDGLETSSRHVNWIRSLYNYMTPFVSKFPRAAYVNYRDLDLGTNKNGKTATYREAAAWGDKYFKDNFKRLARVKNKVDPENFFRNEQSIPLLPEPWK